MSFFDRLFEKDKPSTIVQRKEISAAELEKQVQQAALLQDYLSLKDPAQLVRGISLKDTVRKHDMTITSLAQLKPNTLYLSPNGYPLLRLSKNQCLFAGKSTIDFDPYQLGYNCSLPDMMHIVQQNEVFSEASASTMSSFSAYAANFFQTHLKAEKFSASLNGLDDRSAVNVDCSARVASLDSCKLATDIELQFVNTEEEKEFFTKVEAPAESNIALSIFFSLQEKANDFQVGQLSGSIKQLIDLASSMNPNKEQSAFRGIKGKIEKDSAGLKSYRFTFFFAANLLSLEEFRFFESIILSLQIGQVGRNLDDVSFDEKTPEQSTASSSKSTDEHFLPEFSELAALARIQANQVDPLVMSFLSRLIHPPDPHPAYANLFFPPQAIPATSAASPSSSTASSPLALLASATTPTSSPSSRPPPPTSVPPPPFAPTAGASEQTSAAITSSSNTTPVAATPVPASSPSSSDSSSSNPTFITRISSMFESESDKESSRQRELDAARAAAAQAVAIMADPSPSTSASASASPSTPSSASTSSSSSADLPSSPSISVAVGKPSSLATSHSVKAMNPPPATVLKSILTAASFVELLSVNLKFKTCAQMAERLSKVLNASSAQNLSPWQLQAQTIQNGYSSGRELLTTLLQSIGDQVLQNMGFGFSQIPTDFVEKVYTIYDKLVTNMRKFFKGLTCIHIQASCISLRLLVRSSIDSTSTSSSASTACSVACIDVASVLPSVADLKQVQERQKREAEAEKQRQAELLASKSNSSSGGGRFSQEDFEKLLSLVDADFPSPIWSMHHKDDAGASEVWSRPSANDSSEPDLIRVSVNLDGITAQQAFDLFFDMEVRATWDTYTQETKVLQQYDQNSQVAYTLYYTNFGIAAREFVEYRQVAEIPDTGRGAGKAVLSKSCFHTSAPPRKEHVRGTTLYSGYVFRDVPQPPPASPEDLQPKPKCVVIGLVQQSYGGGLPQRLVSSLNSKVVGGWVQLYQQTLLTRTASARAASGKPASNYYSYL